MLIPVLLGVIGYLAVGYGVASMSWKAWRKGDPATPKARFFFPLVSRKQKYHFGEYYAHMSVLHDWGGDGCGGRTYWPPQGWQPAPARIALYKWSFALKFPLHLGYCLAVNAWFGSVGILKGGLRMLGRFEQQPTLALPEPSDTGREYLKIQQREQELRVEMDTLAVRKSELVRELGGPDEAKKLAALPGKKF